MKSDKGIRWGQCKNPLFARLLEDFIKRLQPLMSGYEIVWFKSEFERRKLMYPLISVFIIVVGALLLIFANKIIKNNKVNRIGIKVVGGILIIVGLLLLYFLLSGKLTLPLSK